MSTISIGQRMRVRPGRLFAGQIVTIEERITDDPDVPLVLRATFEPDADLTVGLGGNDDWAIRLLGDEMWFVPEDLEDIGAEVSA